MPPLVTLTSDLGEQEPNVATIKGVLLSQCPGLQIVDLTHDITCRQVLEGALYVASAVPFFPEGTIHLINVAPGPRPVLARVAGQYLVCPDNGVLSLLCDRYPLEAAREISLSDELANRTGQVFFGREVFAPVAASLANGAAFESIGSVVESLEGDTLPRANRKSDQVVEGEIVHIDRFGSLVTNIHESHIGEAEVSRIEVGHFPLFGISASYSDVPRGKPLALLGSTGYLEIAYNGDRADQRLGMELGIRVVLTLA